ncbi:ATP-binding protein [Phytohabitans houttuyneae]|uniref:Uncharacterized protein n=1 Tax=Phytohabitans houttuyneae TaxID=1076126 RepID=A0A6V8K6H8_9ACTN|nr:tetratricopeptide repeat protein [Phytohabitans houttuyneae]GFJ77357.1 hypothetical protein Phou_015370 [Phytohabitans houttuyneae]
MTAVHRIIMAVDVEGFGNHNRTSVHQLEVRAGLYAALRGAFSALGMSWADCHTEDRGDGILVLATAELPKAPFVELLPDALAAALREHNRSHEPSSRVRVRMVLHAGEVNFDENGVTAGSINLAFRLLDAAPLKAALAGSPGVLALITSAWFFEEVVRNSSRLDAATWRPVAVTVKETNAMGWLCLPDSPYRPDRTFLDVAPGWPSPSVPAQLPAAPNGFTGRAKELDQLTAMLTQPGHGQDPAMAIATIAGMGGIGKTWLALRWAHQHSRKFPDGQLYIDLNGFAPSGVPVAPAQAIRRFLEAMGVPAGSLPADFNAQLSLYSRLVNQRQMLILLDNARDTAQVAPLLPASSTCTVVITSRNRLPGLLLAHGARPLIVEALKDADARELLVNRLGAARVDAEPEAAAELLGYCGGFPLALGIVAGRAQTYSAFALADLAAELREATTRIGVLDDEDPTASLPAILSWSYTALPGDQAQALSFLGVSPLPVIGLAAASDLIGEPPTRTRALLRGLEHAHLLDQHQPGRYRMHDLITLYARDRADEDLSAGKRTDGLRRLLDFLLHTAFAADRMLHPHRPPIELDAPRPDCHPRTFPDYAAALDWLNAEHAVLIAMQDRAGRLGWNRAVWQLAWTLDTFQWRRGHHYDMVVAWQNAVDAAERDGDAAVLSMTHRNLGHAYAHTGRHAEAQDHLGRSLALAEGRGDVAEQAHAHHNLACASEQRGDPGRSLQYAIRALDLYESLDEPARVWRADALNDVGFYSLLAGDHERSRVTLTAALEIFRADRHRDGEAAATANLGYLAHLTGDYPAALSYYDQALATTQELRNQFHEADIWRRVGQTHAASGDREQAAAAWQRSLRLYQEQSHADNARRLQDLLRSLGDG